jgi:EmrB/QacA subfamily drug resistance transporter
VSILKSVKNLIAAILFIEALDATMLYVALPKITLSFEERLLEGDWIIISFLLMVAVFMMIGNRLADYFGYKKVFLTSQAVYILSSLACGFSQSLDQLIIYRIIQGIGAGIIIPIGISYWLAQIPAEKWPTRGSKLYLYEMIFALGLGPLYAGFVTEYLNWNMLFFIRIPFSILFFLISIFLLQDLNKKRGNSFDWKGFIIAALGLYVFLLSITFFSDTTVPLWVSIVLFIASVFLFIWFFKQESEMHHPVIRFSLFKNPQFSLAIFLQSMAMIVFLGAIFILSLFLIGALKFTIVETGFIISSLALGMLAAMLFIKLFYPKYREKPLIIGGLILVAFSMFAFTKVTSDTSKVWIAFLVFLEGLGAWLVRTTNVDVIFSTTSESYLEDASRVYTLTNQIMATLGVALTTTIVRFNLVLNKIPSLSWATPLIAKKAYHSTFIVLGVFPLLGLIGALLFINFKSFKKS